MQAQVIVLAAAGIDLLTYSIPAHLAPLLKCGQRVLVPMRSRKLTGVVVRAGGQFDAGKAQLKPILELLDPEPILDRAHLELLEFMASYYLASLGEVYRGVIPGALRVESRSLISLVRSADPLALASFNATEHALFQALSRHPMAARQLARIAGPQELARALTTFESHGLIERRQAIGGRHRSPAAMTARIAPGAAAKKARGARQQAIMAMLSQAEALSLAQLEVTLPGARAVLRRLCARGLVELLELTAESAPALQPAAEPSPEQAGALNAIAPAIAERRPETFLLWGVTASGKTEVYLQLAQGCLERHRQVLILVPEIALADLLVKSLRARFGALVAVAHSGQSVAERWASWRAALSGAARVMIGPRSAIFAPVRDLGLIVVDEEHDPAYKQEEGIRYNARDLAVALGRFSRCPVVLGSATPSAESFANARGGRYRLLQLPRRVLDRPLAAVEVVDLRQEQAARDRADGARGEARAEQPAGVPLSAALIAALRENLAAGGQSIVFINRRGYHNFLQCHLCGNVISCPNCSVSMTFHLRDRSLRCHYCGERAAAPEVCPACRGLGLAGQGFGTERLVAALSALMPAARIERLDSDTSSRQAARSRILDALGRGELDVLVGTQMIAKGLDFPGVTVVGVVLADMALNMPDFRSAERTFQLLTQVAGRAGRGERPGRVLLQTYAPHHYSIRAARDQDYARFMRRELKLRRDLMYPPYARMALVRIDGLDRGQVERVAAQAAAALGRMAGADGMRVLGPAPAPIERIKQRCRWQVVVKAAKFAALRRALLAMRSEVGPLLEHSEVRLTLDIDPVNMM